MHRPAATLLSMLTLALALALTACAKPPTATPEPMPPTVLPEPPTVELPNEVPVVTATATLTPTATAEPTAAPAMPTAAVAASSPVAAPPTVALPTVAAPSAVATAAPSAVPPTANSGAPIIEFYPDNGQFEIDKDQLCIAVNWRTQNVTDVRLEVGGGKATSVAASGRQADICFGEDKLKMRLIYRLKDGREESQSIEVTRKD